MNKLENISNKTILNSSLLSTMAYLEQQLLQEAEELQEKLVSKEKTDLFIKKNSNVKIDFINYVDLYFKELIEEESYEKIIDQRFSFYQKFKEELKLDNLSANEIYKIAQNDCFIETKKEAAQKMLEMLKVDDENLMNYVKGISVVETKLKLLEDLNEDKKITSLDMREFREKFTQLEFSKEIKEKYKYFDPKNESDINVTFKNGYIEAGKVGKVKDAAMLLGYVEENGENVLYVSFRGTERRVKSALMYFLQNYPNMERQYNYFEPILKDIIQKESKKQEEKYPGKPFRVIFTGHSLGAAIAEKALDKSKDNENVKYNAILVSNPGSFHYLQGVVNKLDEWSHEGNQQINKNENRFSKFKILASVGAITLAKAVVLTSVGLSNYVVGSITVGFQPINIDEKNENRFQMITLGVAKFFNNGLETILTNIKDGSLNMLDLFGVVNKKEADPRCITINHERDNIPILGKALSQNSNPQEIKLKKLIREVEKFVNPWKKIVHVEYHGTEHYYVELKKMDSDKINLLDKILKIRDNSMNNISIAKKNGNKI